MEVLEVEVVEVEELDAVVVVGRDVEAVVLLKLLELL